MKYYQKGNESVKKNIDKTRTNVPNTKDEYSTKIIDIDKLHELLEEGLSAMVYSVGLETMYQLLELDVESIVGPKGRHSKDRTAYRHGTEQSKVVLNDKKICIKKPRVRSDGHDIPLPIMPFLQGGEALDRAMVTRLLCGISTRKYSRTTTAEGGEAACVSKSEASRRFVKQIDKMMDEFFVRPIDDEYPVIMADGIEKGGMTIVTALGVSTKGQKAILGIIEGGTENSVVVKRLFEDLIERGLRTDVPRLFVVDGAKALCKAVNDTFGGMAMIQRCQVHKKRNVQSHLPESEKANIGLAISRAYMEHEYDEAFSQLNAVADGLERRYPDAAASIREGLEETLTVHLLGVPGLLRKTLASTNAIESANSVAAGTVRRITKWRDGEMVLKRMAVGFLEAERGFKRIQGYKEMPDLMMALQVAVGMVDVRSRRATV